jgi:MFS family permease
MNQDNTSGQKQLSFAALRHRGARAYLLGAALAMMADSIEHVISYWMIFQKFESPALGGFAVIAHWLPFLLFSVWAGALADRFDPRRLIQLGMALFILASLGWGILFLTDVLEMWHAVVLLVIHGFAGVLWAPAGQMLVHDIVGRENLQSAVRMLATSRMLGMLLGPALGGGIMLAIGPAYGLLVNALIYLPLTLWLWKAPYGPKFRIAQQAATRAVRGLADIVSTIRTISTNHTILTMVILAGGAALFVGNAHQAQMPEFSRDLGHGSDGVFYSLLLAANAGGALLAGLVLESRSLLPAHPRTACLLLILWCFSVIGFAVSTDFALSLGLLFLGGFLDLSYNSMAQTLVQLRAPDDIRGRVIGLYIMASNGLRAFSGVTIGLGGSLVGIHWSLGLSAAVLLILALMLLGFIQARVAPAGAGAD